MNASWLDAPICKPADHDWKWVPTCMGVGYDECRRCGTTTPLRFHTDPRPAPKSDAFDRSAARDSGLSPGRFAAEHDLSATGVGPSSRSIDRAPSDPARWAKKGPAVAARNAEILAALARGERVEDVAARHGLTAARVYQIRAAGRAAS